MYPQDPQLGELWPRSRRSSPYEAHLWHTFLNFAIFKLQKKLFGCAFGKLMVISYQLVLHFNSTTVRCSGPQLLIGAFSKDKGDVGCKFTSNPQAPSNTQCRKTINISLSHRNFHAARLPKIQLSTINSQLKAPVLSVSQIPDPPPMYHIFIEAKIKNRKVLKFEIVWEMGKTVIINRRIVREKVRGLYNMNMASRHLQLKKKHLSVLWRSSALRGHAIWILIYWSLILVAEETNRDRAGGSGFGAATILGWNTGTKEILEYLQHCDNEDDEEEEPEEPGLTFSKKEAIAAAQFLQKVAHYRPDLEAALPLAGCLYKFCSALAQEVEEAKVQTNITSFFK
ncbi:hypothetical protein C8R43DRAFT_947873 [Mycena crocata]|nr:hypothetical protein C8R43DRAFT_947873 [Mycena crocata]